MTPRPLLLSALSVSFVAAAAAAQSIHRSVTPLQVGEQLGASVARLSDVNGDGYLDWAVGAPNPGGVGSVKCISGRFLALGLGQQVLWSHTRTSNFTSERLGAALASVGDIDSDGVWDLAIGEPGLMFQIVFGVYELTGGVWLVSGATGQALAISLGPADSEYGAALANTGDLDGDGFAELAIGAPSDSTAGTQRGSVHVISPRKYFAGLPGALLHVRHGAQNFERLGTALAAGDFDGDGKRELVLGAPLFDGFMSTDAGRVLILRGANFTEWRTLFGSGGARLGSAVSALGDIDGDGVPDLVAGAPYDDAGASDAGAVIAYSGARLAAGAAPYDFARWNGSLAGEHHGAAVAISNDLNGDGRSDVLVGAPDYDSPLLGQSGNGALFDYSGETLTRMGLLVGANGDRLGHTVVGTADYSGDGWSDVVTTAPLSDGGALDAGRLHVVSLFPALANSYCTAKTNSVGCAPAISALGLASASSGAVFDVRATNVLNQKLGLLFYGFAPSNAPFQGGTLCVAPPTLRTPLQSSAGSPSGANCTGTFSFDFNDLIASGAVPALSAGQQVFCQYWYRDPASPSTTGLTNGLRFLINP